MSSSLFTLPIVDTEHSLRQQHPYNCFFFIGKMKSARLFYVLALIDLVIYQSRSGSESDKILSLGAEPFVATMDKRFSGRNFFCLFG